MRLTKIELGNWKNFVQAEARLAARVFIIGTNGVGKSNLLDAFRFLHDIAKEGGGLRNALERRGGIGKIRSVFARQNPTVRICVEADDDLDDESAAGENERAPLWRYELVLREESRGKRRTLVSCEKVEKDGETILSRPDQEDNKDDDRLRQTALEQTGSNQMFRELADFFESFRYLHMVPQLVRHAPEFQGRILPDDPFGQELMDSIASQRKNEQKASLRRIGDGLRSIMPQIDPAIQFERDERTGKPHLKVRYQNWRPRGVWQNEEQLSDGALRLIGLIWSLMERRKVVMLEEPEISFNENLVKKLPDIFDQVISDHRGKSAFVSQVILTTHSAALLGAEGIGGDEVLLLMQAGQNIPSGLFPQGKENQASAFTNLSREGTRILRVCDSPRMMAQLKSDEDASVADVALRYGKMHGDFSL